MHRPGLKIKVNDPPADVGPMLQSGNPPEEQEEIRMIGDFDGNADALWSLYGHEAKSYDEARIQTLKGDMDGVLIFVRQFICVNPDHADPQTYRQVYFRLSSPPSSSTANRI